jgi:hypothetical protein
MRREHLLLTTLPVLISLFFSSCQKNVSQATRGQQEPAVAAANPMAEQPTFNLEVILRGEGNAFGLVKFRQDVDPSKIITLDTWVRDLQPNHSYLLQRAVDPANVVDGNCTSTSWLTLGKGLTPQSITTDDTGTGREDLWRDVSAVPSGSSFDIHFRVVDATTMAVVLTSDCYQYKVR